MTGSPGNDGQRRPHDNSRGTRRDGPSAPQKCTRRPDHILGGSRAHRRFGILSCAASRVGIGARRISVCGRRRGFRCVCLHAVPERERPKNLLLQHVNTALRCRSHRNAIVVAPAGSGSTSRVRSHLLLPWWRQSVARHFRRWRDRRCRSGIRIPRCTSRRRCSTRSTTSTDSRVCNYVGDLHARLLGRILSPPSPAVGWRALWPPRRPSRLPYRRISRQSTRRFAAHRRSSRHGCSGEPTRRPPPIVFANPCPSLQTGPPSPRMVASHTLMLRFGAVSSDLQPRLFLVATVDTLITRHSAGPIYIAPQR